VRDVRYYLINQNGRVQLPADNDEEALAEARALQVRYTTPQKRIVRETRETIWEAST
jgi:hypothetical protein